eukprot:scaffold8259_cov143-Cylindrotheca_fusiformis.AAC.5
MVMAFVVESESRRPRRSAMPKRLHGKVSRTMLLPTGKRCIKGYPHGMNRWRGCDARSCRVTSPSRKHCGIAVVGIAVVVL